MFLNIDGHKLSPGLFAARAKLKFKVTPGQKRSIVKIVYYSGDPWSIGSTWHLKQVFVQIYFKAEINKHYRPNAFIENGLAHIWIEEIGGEKVSNTVTAELTGTEVYILQGEK